MQKVVCFYELRKNFSSFYGAFTDMKVISAVCSKALLHQTVMDADFFILGTNKLEGLPPSESGGHDVCDIQK